MLDIPPCSFHGELLAVGPTRAWKITSGVCCIGPMSCINLHNTSSNLGDGSGSCDTSKSNELDRSLTYGHMESESRDQADQSYASVQLSLRTSFSFHLVWFYWGLTPQQQPGSYQGGEMMMKSVFWWRKPE